MSCLSPPLFTIFLLTSLSLLAGNSSLPAIGITYTPPTTTSTSTASKTTASSSSAVSPDHIATTLQTLKLSSVRLLDPDPTIIRSFAYSNTSLLLTIPNALVPSLANNRSVASLWIYRHVVPFYPRAKISIISVGNDILESSPDLSDFLIPALRNIQLALRDIGIRKISVSSTFSFINIMTTSFPPSSAEFQEPVAEMILKPLLQFLEDTNSSFLVNIYPYNVYRINSEIPIGFALFQEHPFNFRDDLTTGVRYRNLFDMMVDAVISAMAVAGHENIPVIVTETGWPSSADASEMDANELYAGMYIEGLVRYLNSGIGTPLRREGVAGTYIYELFDRDVKQERHWGIFYPNMTKKYNFDFSSGNGVGEGRGSLQRVVAVIVLLRIAALILQESLRS